MYLKRLFRELKYAPLKNICYLLLITLSVMLIVSLNRSSSSYLTTLESFYTDCQVESGEFTIYGALSKRQCLNLSQRFGVGIEEQLTVDKKLKVEVNSKEPILRLICSKHTINALAIIKGRPPELSSELVLDPKFATTHGYPIGDHLTVGGYDFEIVGYGISPNYTYTLKHSSDFMNNPASFGVGYVNEDGYNQLKTENQLMTTYSFIQRENHDLTPFKRYLEDHYMLTGYLLKADNTRIQMVFNDAKSPMEIGLIVGILLLIIVTFIISISIKNTIAMESQTIGILYAQGFNKSEVLKGYLLLPLLLSTLGIMLGYLLGIPVSRPLLIIQDGQYTIPPVVMKDSLYLIVVGIILPFVLTLAITYFSISKALCQTPLSLLRGHHASNKVSKLERRFTFKNFRFLTRFRLKAMLREKGSLITLFFGVLLAVTFLLFGFFLKDSCKHYLDGMKRDLPYNYLYSFESPKLLDKYKSQGEPIMIKTVLLEFADTEKQLILQGIKSDSAFFTAFDLEALEDNEVYISPCLQHKFNLQVGQVITLKDDLENKTYTVSIKGLAPYDYGQYLFTNTDSFNKILGNRKMKYSALMTPDALPLSDDITYTKSSKEEMIHSLDPFINMINTLTNLIIVIALCILVTVVYMLLKIILDKDQINISMVKIFGYSEKEVNHLYLRGYFVFIILGFILGIPLAYYLAKFMHDQIFVNMQYYFLPHIFLHSIIFAFTFLSLGYYLSIYLIKRNIRRIALSEALKNRE